MLEKITEHTKKGAAINELQGFTTTIAAGAAATTNIAIAGIKLTDTIQSVVGVDFAGTALNDLTANASITSDGNIQLDVDGSGQSLLVQYWSKA